MSRNRDQNSAPRGHWFWLALLFALAAAVRAAYLIHPVIDSDVAVVGLMGKHLLAGEFSPLYWGQDYGGSQEALVAGGLFALFGASRYALNAAATVFSLLYLAGLYLLGRETLSRRAGLMALGLAAVGPFFLSWYSVQARGINIEVLAAGTWLLVVTARMLKTESGSRAHAWLCLAFGLIAGFGLWAHMLMVYFVAPAGIMLLIHDWRLLIRPRLGLMALGFGLGALPLWYHNLQSLGGTLRYLLTPKPQAGFMESLDYLLGASLPALTGLRLPGEETWLIPGLSQLMGLISLAALIWAFWAWGGDLLRRIAGHEGGGGLLLLTLVSVSLVFCLLGGAASHSSRYLLSFYAVWPLVMAFACDRLLNRGGSWRALGWGVLLLTGAFYLYGSLITTPMADQREREMHLGRWQANLELTDFFAKQGVRYVYMEDYWDAVRATFDADERVIYLLPHGNRYPGYLAGMLKDGEPAFLVRPWRGEDFRQLLDSLGASYERTEGMPGGFIAYSHIRPPATRPVILDPDGFIGSGVPPGGWPTQAWDLSAATRFSSRQAQRPGQNLTLDLGREVPGVCQVLVFSGSIKDLPKGLRLEGSQDGQSWRELAGISGLKSGWFWSAGKPVSPKLAPWQELRFPPQPLRWLRISQTGEDAHFWWSTLEVLVGAQGGETPAPLNPDQAARWLTKELGPEAKVYAGPALSAYLPEAMRPAPDPWAERPPWLREYLDPGLLIPDSAANFALPLGLAPAARRALAACGWVVEEKTAHGYALLKATPPKEAEPGKSVVCGLTPQATGQGLVLDLGASREVAGLVISGSALDLFTPQGLRLEAADGDGQYRPLTFAYQWSPRLYWAGILPLAARPYPIRLKFAPATARRLRLSPAPGSAMPPWPPVKVDALGPAS